MTIHIIAAADDKYPAASKKLADVLAKTLGIKPTIENPDDPDEERYQAYQFTLKSKASALDFTRKSSKVADLLEKQGFNLDEEHGDLAIYSDENNGVLVYLSLDPKDVSNPWVEILRD